MFEKMIETQTKKQEHKLERWMKKHDSEHPFPDDVVLHEKYQLISGETVPFSEREILL